VKTYGLDNEMTENKRQEGNIQPSAISVEGLSVSLGGTLVLEDVSFTIEHGVMVALVGPNGAGKSTLFKAILGLLPVSRGQVLIHGTSFSEVAGELAYIPQNEQINWSFPLTVWDVVMLGRERRIGWFRRPSRIDKDVVEACLERVGLQSRRGSLISELSGGQRQRIFVARALAQEAHTLMLDEAFSGIDVASQEGLMDMLTSLRSEGKTVLVSTHDLNNVSKRFDLVCCLNRHICAFGTPSEAFTPEVLEELYGSHGRLMLDVGVD
jgi:ABC-type Mn2+/Zn2+ transport system ATPase subunit